MAVVMTERTITCPNGCDPADLEREHWERMESEEGDVTWRGIPAGVRYTCHACGWEADWNPRQGLMVNDPGHLAPVYDRYD